MISRKEVFNIETLAKDIKVVGTDLIASQTNIYLPADYNIKAYFLDIDGDYSSKQKSKEKEFIQSAISLLTFDEKQSKIGVAITSPSHLREYSRLCKIGFFCEEKLNDTNSFYYWPSKNIITNELRLYSFELNQNNKVTESKYFKIRPIESEIFNKEGKLLEELVLLNKKSINDYLEEFIKLN